MKYTLTCPVCEHKNSVIPIMIALTPFSFKCSKCRKRIYIRDIRLKLLGLIALIGAGIIFLIQYLWIREDPEYFIALIIPALFLVLMEFALAVFICNKARLEVKR
jgi:peptidoglycan/LPS O-acetylase OafA/YrhL